jgi:anti-sigma factor ChrR (cupin superfamily)
MKINADFAARAAVHFDAIDWIASPMPGVDRKMLDRIGAEVARATSIVRYAPGSAFSAHTHDGGEEYLVLEGTFVDDYGSFPTGTYVRNPPTSRHTPSAPDGAVILVKLHQFDAADRTQFHKAIGTAGNIALHGDAFETVRIESWAPGAAVALDTVGGAEIFVLDGGFEQAGEAFTRWDWLRLPDGTQATATAGPQGARVWIKTGHLAHVKAPE